MVFKVHGSVHRNNILIYIQQVTTLHSLTLFDLQLDAQNSHLFTYNTFIKILYMFQELFLNWCTGQSPAESDDTRGCLYTITT